MTLMLLMALWGLGRPSLYAGEAATYYAGTLPVRGLLHLVRHVDAVHGTYYLLMHATFMLGHDYVTLRLPSVAGAVGTVGLSYALARRLTGSPRVATIAGLLIAVSPGMSQYAQSGRSYAIVTMVSVGCGLALLRAVERPAVAARWRAGLARWLLYGALLGLCGYLHEVAMVLLVLSHGSALLLARVRRELLLRWAVTAAVAALLVLPLVLVSLGESGVVTPPRPDLQAAYSDLTLDFGTSTVVLVVLVALAVLGSVPVRRADPSAAGEAARRALLPPTLSAQWFLVPVLVVPPVVLYVESLVGKSLFDTRYILFCLPPAMTLSAIGVDRVARAIRLRGAGLWVPALVLVLLTAALQWQEQAYLRTPDSRTWNLAAGADYLRPRVRPGDGITYVPNSLDYVGLAYPDAVRGTDDYRLSRSPRQVPFHGTQKHGALLRRSMLRHRRIWLVQDPVKVRTSPGGLRDVALLQSRYRTVSTYRWHHGQVSLLVRVRHRDARGRGSGRTR
jgi:mannosyltransferase